MEDKEKEGQGSTFSSCLVNRLSWVSTAHFCSESQLNCSFSNKAQSDSNNDGL